MRPAKLTDESLGEEGSAFLRDVEQEIGSRFEDDGSDFLDDENDESDEDDWSDIDDLDLDEE